MATNLADLLTRERTALQRLLGRSRFLSLLGLLGLLAVCLAFSWVTHDAMAHLSFLKSQRAQFGASSQTTIVDLHPWQIAQALAPLAVSKEEDEYAHEAARLADHEVDQAFATALRQANAQRLTPTGEAIELSQKVAQLQQMAKEDQARVRSLTALAAGATDGATSEDLKVAQAQLGLDQDELSDAQHDLARASGDVRTKIQQELAAQQAAVSKTNAQPGSANQLAVLSSGQYGTLAGRVEAWFSQRNRYQLIQQALQQANTDVASLTTQHNALEALANASSAVSDSPKPDAATLASLQQRREQRQLLSIFDDRIQTQQQLAGVYGKWANQVLLQHRIVTHLALRSLATLAFILICVILLEAAGKMMLDRQALGSHTFDPRRMQTLQTILRLSVQLIGIVCVLLVTFGVPSQISTIVGLATAGLTVALQSFILAFFGWFILMGKNGMRLGDWVQINGVAGEVIEINLFRTTILETSDWADKGHPTGRRATFINNFAVTGQFFNFSTVGQWMWDEMSINLPSSAETYAKVELIHKAVLEETQQDAEIAEEEWKRVPRQSGLSRSGASPSVNMRPTGAGVDILIRYVTRASDRLQVRNRLYERVIDVIYKPAQVVISSSQPSKLTAAVLAASDPFDHDHRDKRASMYT